MATIRENRITGLEFLLLKTAEPKERFDLCAITTLLLLLLYSSNFWYIHIPITILCISAFIFSPFRYNAKFWFIVSVTILIGNYQNWFEVDNHKYLLGYWSLALFCSLQTEAPEKKLAEIARWLIGLSFLFAVFWKTMSGDYLNNSFFNYSLLLDERFNTIAKSLGGLTDEMNKINHAAQRAIVNYDSKLEAAQLIYPSGIVALSGFLTWWTFFIELIVAVSFLWPEGKFISKWRDFSLILFIISTYSVAPVLGFGWVLVIMGFAQCSCGFKYTPLLYMISFIGLQIYLLPWNNILNSAFQ